MLLCWLHLLDKLLTYINTYIYTYISSMCLAQACLNYYLYVNQLTGGACKSMTLYVRHNKNFPKILKRYRVEQVKKVWGQVG